ncbi:MAG: AEC family transporter [Alphaproteobacteria bacterium]|nr:AEC family transporter [Alphaproteobacteria bacterium]MDX5369317.1 AEC family transporter [Alphaproteobacteria bacterium]MDX5464002.1 AEC family transporter [Alphaproteobacteria bacterium]
MEQVLGLTIPFFAVAGLGYAASAAGMMGGNAVRSLNVFVFYFAMPALMVGAIARKPFEELIEPAFLAGYTGSGLFLFVVAAVIGRLLFRLTPGEATVMGQASVISNSGYLGVPLAIAAFGDWAVAPVALAMIGDFIVIAPLTLAVLEASRGGAGSAGRGLLRAFKGLALNPFVISIVIGLAISASGLGFSGVTERFVSFLAGAAGPAALFALGASLYGRPMAEGLASVSVVTVLKLFAHPALVYVALSNAPGVPGEWVAVGVLVAALPIAGNVFVIAENYQIFSRRVSSAILFTTALAAVTVAGTLALFQN